MAWTEIVLFIIAIFGCIFGVYQYLTKNTTKNAETDTLVMTELRHIGSDITEMKSDIRTFQGELRGTAEQIIELRGRVTSTENNLNTAFVRIDEVRDKTEEIGSRVTKLEKDK